MNKSDIFLIKHTLGIIDKRLETSHVCLNIDGKANFVKKFIVFDNDKEIDVIYMLKGKVVEGKEVKDCECLGEEACKKEA